MTPMIDVVFQLLIFFICTASFQKQEEFLSTSLTMPNTSGNSVEPPPDPKIDELEPIIVKVLARDGRLRWQVGEAEYAQLADVGRALTALAQVQDQLPVILDVDGPVLFGDVVGVYDVCRLSGFARIQFAAKVR